jgi:hypothetical protein
VARFRGRIFAVNFVMGMVTGLPMELHFGTNWARFSAYAGGVIGWTLAMEGMFAFFAESAFLGLFLFGEKRLGPRGHVAATFMVFLCSWLSGFFIIVTHAFMQHPVGQAASPAGSLHLDSVWTYLLNPWALWQYAHTITAAVVTGSTASDREHDRRHASSQPLKKAIRSAESGREPDQVWGGLDKECRWALMATSRAKLSHALCGLWCGARGARAMVSA